MTYHGKDKNGQVFTIYGGKVKGGLLTCVTKKGVVTSTRVKSSGMQYGSCKATPAKKLVRVYATPLLGPDGKPRNTNGNRATWYFKTTKPFPTNVTLYVKGFVSGRKMKLDANHRSNSQVGFPGWLIKYSEVPGRGVQALLSPANSGAKGAEVYVEFHKEVT